MEMGLQLNCQTAIRRLSLLVSLISGSQSQKSKSALLSILPHVPYINTEN